MTNRVTVLACVAIAALAACSQSSRTIRPGEPGSDAAKTASYVIGPGDTLEVFVLANPELTTQVLVRPDGKISTPLVDDMIAVGKSPTELAEDVEEVLATYVRSPTVSIMVTKPTSAFSQVRVVGQAASPKAISFRNGMTVLDVVIEVGGLSQFAAGNRAEIIRTGSDGDAEKIRVRLHDLINRGDISQNIPLQPGDVLLIPEARF